MAPTISDTPLSNRYVWVSAYIISTSIIQLRKKTSLACSKKKYATILLTQQRQDTSVLFPLDTSWNFKWFDPDWQNGACKQNDDLISYFIIPSYRMCKQVFVPFSTAASDL